MFCGKCGTQVAEGAAFCGNCGAPVAAAGNAAPAASAGESRNFTQQPQSARTGTGAGAAAASSASVDEETLQVAYITGQVGGMNRHSKACQHYLGAFRRFASAGSKVNWHWAAFVFSIYTVAYRKNFLIAFVGYIVSVIISLFSSGGLLVFLALLYGLVFGMFSDYLCYRRYREKLTAAQHSFPNNPAQQEQFLANAGGVSKGVIVFLVVMYILSIIIVLAVVGAAAAGYYYY